MATDLVDLRLIRTMKTDPVVSVGASVARESEDGTLVWEGSPTYVYTGESQDGESQDPHRFDQEIAGEFLRRAANWCPDPKLARKMRKILKKMVPNG